MVGAVAQHRSLSECVLVSRLHHELSITRGDAWPVVLAQLDEGAGLLVPHATHKTGALVISVDFVTVVSLPRL